MYLARDGWSKRFTWSGLAVNTLAGAIIGTRTPLAFKPNNILRLGPNIKGGPFRVSIGAQARYWSKLPRLRQRLQPLHAHFERTKGAIANNHTGRVLWKYGDWK